MIVLTWVLTISAFMLFLPGLVLTVEILCALYANKPKVSNEWKRPLGVRATVIVPAHNEEYGIGATVSGIAKQLGASDRLIVVADNCTDATAQRAEASGAETITRFDPDRHGKGYALDFGIQRLAAEPPDIIIIIDADCHLGPRTIDMLVERVCSLNRPVQAFYEMGLPETADAKRRLAGFAWIVKNHVRPTGLASLGLPCQLMGTGMAFPWEAIWRIDLATGNIVEDIKMGLDLAAAGFAPVYCPEVSVKSEFPTTEQGFTVQRQRWETGSLRTITSIVPAMFLRGLGTFNMNLTVMTIDLAVPPVMMLVATMIFGLMLSVIFAIAGGNVLPAALFCGALSLLILALSLAWFRFGREVLRTCDLLALPSLLVRKFGFYLIMWRDRGTGWVRTDRK